MNQETSNIRPFVAFDLEIARELLPPPITDYGLGITCAATLRSGQEEPLLWYLPGESPEAELAEAMEPNGVCALCEYLVQLHAEGYDLVTWNGMGFDFRVLLAEAQPSLEQYDDLIDLAWNQIDPAFQMLCERGFMVGLDKLAQGMGLAGKTEGMSGALAPRMWKEGREAQNKILEYVAQDARATAEVYEQLITRPYAYWITSNGRRSRDPWQPIKLDSGYGSRLLTVREAAALPEPDTSWMTQPRQRADFIQWAQSTKNEEN
jgi:hypothetical protein